jgi:putative transposase
VAWCIDSEGRKHLLHLAVGNKESEAAWTSFFRDMVSRGLRLPTTVTTDGAPGMIKAVDVVLRRSIRIRCWFHRLANIYAVRDAPTLDAARAAADRFENTYAKTFPAAAARFREDREALLAIHRVQVRHRIRVRTTNLAERGFEEERRRAKVIPRLMSEQATMKLAFATMIRASERGCRVSINDIERHQLMLLRAKLGLDPPPAGGHTNRRRRTTERVAA